jgi:hypothetical protein
MSQGKPEFLSCGTLLACGSPSLWDVYATIVRPKAWHIHYPNATRSPWIIAACLEARLNFCRAELFWLAALFGMCMPLLSVPRHGIFTIQMQLFLCISTSSIKAPLPFPICLTQKRNSKLYLTSKTFNDANYQGLVLITHRLGALFDCTPRFLLKNRPVCRPSNPTSIMCITQPATKLPTMWFLRAGSLGFTRTRESVHNDFKFSFYTFTGRPLTSRSRGIVLMCASKSLPTISHFTAGKVIADATTAPFVPKLSLLIGGSSSMRSCSTHGEFHISYFVL